MTNVRVGEVTLYERQASEPWEYNRASVHCASCGLFVGALSRPFAALLHCDACLASACA